MGRVRDAIIAGTFPDFLRSFFRTYYAVQRRSNDKSEALAGDGGPTYPKWCVDALRSVGVDILEGIPDARVVDGNGAKWEYAVTNC